MVTSVEFVMITIIVINWCLSTTKLEPILKKTAKKLQGGGYSRLVDPAGRILVECGEDEQVAIVDIDAELVTEIREHFPVLGDRLDDYSGISSESGAEV